MKLVLISLALIVSMSPRSLSGQPLPTTNNNVHYDNSTAKKEISSLYHRLKAGYAFDQLAREYSQDYGSYTVGGELGWQQTGQFVPIFDKVVSRMTKGQLSKPFRTEFGYHIVQLLGKRQSEVLTRHILLRVGS